MKTMKTIDTTKMDAETIALLQKVFEEVACEDTAYDKDLYKENMSRCKVFGNCVPISSFVKKYWKGSIVTCKVKDQSHYWNLLPDGKQFDFTSKQYFGDGITPISKEFRKQNLRLNNKRAILFEKNVFLKLQELGYTV